MKALKLTIEGTVELIELTSDRLASYYEHIGCRCITSITPMPGSILDGFHEPITGWGDDEGLFVEQPEVNMTAMVAFGYPPTAPLVGVWLVTGHNDEGDTTQLSDAVLALAGHDVIDFIDFAPGRTDG
jgi:hypothetical protein